MSAAREAIILAAGVGSRLRPLTDAHPKALVPLGGRAIIDHVLDALVAHGIESAVVVVGYARDTVARHLARRGDVRITLVDNAAYATTNTLASLVCAIPFTTDDALLLDGDLVFDPELLRPMAPPGNLLAVDRDRPLDDDAVKVAVAGDRVTHVGKVLPAGVTASFESIGLARLERATLAALLPLGQRQLARGEDMAYYEAAFQHLIDEGAAFRAADVTGLRWVEIDDHDDRRRAEALFVAA